MLFCLSLLACPPQSLHDCPSTLTKVLLQQMPWILASHREHMYYYQKLFGMTLKHPCCYVNILLKKKETKPKNHSCSNCWLLKTVPVLWTCFAFYHLLEKIKGKGLSKSPLSSTTYNQTLTLASTYKHIFCFSLLWKCREWLHYWVSLAYVQG